MRVQRGGHADGDKVDILDKAEVGGGGKHAALDNAGKVAVHHVADVVVAGVDHLHLLRLDVEADGLKARFGLLDRQRQADIAQTHYSDNDLSVFNLAEHFIFHHL